MEAAMTLQAVYELGVPVVPVAVDQTPRDAVAEHTGPEGYIAAPAYLVAPADDDGPVYAVAGEQAEAERLGALVADALGWVAGDAYGAESNTRLVWVVAVSPS
jgi:hypothetical protein